VLRDPLRFTSHSNPERKDNVVFSVSRRSLLRGSGIALTAGLLPHAWASLDTDQEERSIHLNLNENAWGPSPRVSPALEREFSRLARYADAVSAQTFAEQIAAYERVSVDQVVLGEILGALGLWLASQGGAGGEFVYSTPGYLALIDAAAHLGGVGVPVPLNNRYENDLPELRAKVGPKTRALYLINPHNPTGTVSDPGVFLRFLSEVSQGAPAIVDEAYLEYTSEFESRSAVSLVRDGANVVVFRTFDKIHGLAGLPIGYTIAPRKLAAALRAQGLGDAESLGRLNIAAASAALGDAQHVVHVRDAVTAERAKWNAKLDELTLAHTDSKANFVFFNAGRPQGELASLLRKRGIEIGRAFPPYTNWVRITIGLPEENQRVQQVLQSVLY
jgi:histidinol-phosphate aminotransferase